MGIYRTHLIVNRKDSLKIESLSIDNMKFKFINEPSNCYWEGIDGKSFSYYSKGKSKDSPNIDEIPQLELLIEADSEEKAEDLVIQTKFDNVDIIPANSELSGAQVELVNMIARESRLKNGLNEKEAI